MTIRAFLENWIKESCELFPQGTLFPIAVQDPNAVETPLNEDGTITLEVTFAVPQEMTAEQLKDAVDSYLETVKDLRHITTSIVTDH